MIIEILPIESIEQLDDFQDEYVYDIQMEDETDHTFFANDILVHNSCYITLKPIFESNKWNLVDSKGDLTPEYLELENKIGNHINVEIDKWARTQLNSKDPRFHFKRESVCPKAIWAGKKHYILYIVNKEGKKMNDLKYSGLMITKSTYSKAVTDISRRVVEIIMGVFSKSEANEKIFQAYDNFESLTLVDIAERASIKILNKYEGLNRGLEVAKGTTRPAKFVIYHNELLKMLHLENKYKKITNGSKIKMVNVLDNRWNIPGIAFQDELPEEFGLQADYESAFFKGVIKALTPIYDALGWEIPNPRIRYTVDLRELYK